MTFSKFKESTKHIYEELKILDIFELNSYLVSFVMYSPRTNTLQKTFIAFCKMMIYVTTTPDQQRIRLHMEYIRTNYGKFSLKAKGAKIWNDLLDDIKNSHSCSTFKRKMKMILFNT